MNYQSRYAYLINAKHESEHEGWRGGATVGRRTCDQEVASSIPGQGTAA